MTAEATKAPVVSPMTRREFLYYIWFGSLAVFGAQAGVALLWFAYPRFKAGTFGGIFEIDISELPPTDSAPKAYAGGRFWLVNIGDGIQGDARQPAKWKPVKGAKALYMICVHLGCLYAWVPTSNRFECPCHGSKYLSSGTAIAGPANRNLDVFEMEVVDANNLVIDRTELVQLEDGTSEGRAVNLENAAKLRINTGRRIAGASNPTPFEANA